MGHTVLTGIEKSAVLLMCLGEDATAQIFNELSDSHVHKLTQTMASINHIPLHVKKHVLEQYVEAQEQFSGVFLKGSEFAKNSLYATNSGERTETLLHRHITETETKPFASLAGMKPQVTANILEHEHPQIIALIISTQPSNHGASIISFLPETMQADVIHRIARLEHISEDVLQNLENIFTREIGQTASLEQKQIKGFHRAVDLLNKMNSNQHTNILESLEETDDQMADKIRRQMFSFESLIDLDDRSLQMILREINNESLAVAMQNCSNELRNRIFSNMSSRAVAMLRDDLDSLGEIRASEIKAMQQSIVKTAISLEEQGAFLAAPHNAYERE